MPEVIRVAVLGAGGKMGREVVRAVAEAPDMSLVGACDTAFAGRPLSDGVVRSDWPALLNPKTYVGLLKLGRVALRVIIGRAVHHHAAQ